MEELFKDESQKITIYRNRQYGTFWNQHILKPSLVLKHFNTPDSCVMIIQDDEAAAVRSDPGRVAAMDDAARQTEVLNARTDQWSGPTC